MVEEELPEDLEPTIPPVYPEPGRGETPDEQELGQPSPTLGDRVADTQDKIEQGKGYRDRFRNWQAARAEKKAAKQGLKEGVEKKGAEAARRKVATRATEEAGKQVLKRGAVATGGKVVGGILAKQAVGSVVPVIGNIVMAIVSGLQLLWPAIKKAVPYVIYGVAGLLLLLAAAFGLLGGKNPPVYPTTTAHETQATALAAISGSATARNILVFGTVDAERTRMGRFKSWVSQVYGNNASAASGATTRIKEVTSLLDTFEITTVATDKKKITVQIQEKLSSFATDFPELVGYGAVHGYPLTVPGVIEAAGGDCGAASILMVSLYYKQKPGDDVYNATRRASRKAVCVSPNYLNEHSPFQDWVYATSGQASFASVKKSLAAGNPVVLYTAAGGIYGPSKKGYGGKHIVVIVGYDPADQTFFVNNPSPKKVDIATKTPHGRKMTEDHLRQFLGDGTYGHSYIIRKAFW